MIVEALLAALVVVSALLGVVLWAVWSAVTLVERSKHRPDQSRPGTVDSEVQSGRSGAALDLGLEPGPAGRPGGG